MDCRERKRQTNSALLFEINVASNLAELYEELIAGTYRPGRSICFVITRPKPREVWAADFRDRIVHHLLYNYIGPRFERAFTVESCACIRGRGTLYGAKRLESKVRSLTENWSKPAWYLKVDLANFFVSIDKRLVFELLERKIPEPWWLELTRTILFHDPRADFEYHGERFLLDHVPTHKRLTCQPDTHGLPIGNLSSQFFANVLLNELDQYVKRVLHVRHYIRYVDDAVCLGRSAQYLEAVHHAIALFLPDRLGLRLNESKTIIHQVDRGIDFVGFQIKPWRRTLRRRTFNDGLSRLATLDATRLRETANSYFGLCRQASHSHHDRVRIGRLLLRRGHCVVDLKKVHA